MTDALLSADVLHALGFRKMWTQGNRRANFVLWLGDSRQHCTGTDDVGLELSPNADEPGALSDDPRWFCWLRSDTVQSRGRFCFIRFMRKRNELVALIEAVTGQPYNRERIEHGCFRYPGQHMERDEGAADGVE